MKYKILDKVNNEYLDLTKYCVNGFGDVMTIKGLVPMNQNDYKIEYEIKDIVVETLAETNESYNISGRPNEKYIALEEKIKTLEYILELFD
jgi:hypothetical protein